MTLDFGQDGLLDRLEDLPADALDEVGFGIVRMEGAGRVVAYNRYESRLAGLSPDRVLGRSFFTEVAPCTNNHLVAERYRTEPELDAQLDYMFTLRMKPTLVRLRLLQSARARHQYLLVKR